MRLISAELTNYCQHRYLQVRFVPGLTAILGRNGSGKSNLIKAIYAGPTGDFGRNDGLKTDNICQFSSPAAPSRINIVIEHAGTILDITRSLRPVATRLVMQSIDGSNKTIITKTSEANEAILNTLGVSGRLLADYVFVDQWSIFNFLSMVPAERAKAFQRLFKTEQAESLWKMVGEHHDKLIVPTPGIDKDAVIRRLTETRENLVQLNRKYQDFKLKKDAINVKNDKAIISDWQKKQLLDKELADATKQCEILHGEIENLEIKKNQLEKDRDVLRNHIGDRGDKYEAARSELSDWSSFKRYEADELLLTEQLESLRGNCAGLVNPERPAGCIEVHDTDWHDQHNERVRRYNAAQHFINMLTADDPFCPTCGTPRRALETHRKEYERTILELGDVVAKENKQLQDSEAYRTEKRSYDAKKADLAKRQAFIESQLSVLIAVKRPNRSEDELRKFLKDFDAYRDAYSLADKDFNIVSAEYIGKCRTLDHVTRHTLLPLSKEAGKLTILESDVSAATSRLEAYDTLNVDCMRLDAEISVLQRNIRDDELSLKQLERIEIQAADERAWADYCLDMRHVLHRDNLPHIVAENYLEVMQDEINSLLTRFDSPFNVITDKSLSFIAVFKDGRKVPASRLSGGEKVLLALAFRVAVNDIFARDLGLLVLDEPTAGLDDGNLSCLKIALERLKELSSSRGLQMIMITHEKELSYLFDHTIELGKE